LKEFGDKIPDDKKKPIEDSLAKLKEAHKNQDVDAIDAATKEVNDTFQAASQDIYNAQQEQQGGSDAGAGQPTAEGAEAQAKDEEVTDVDFEEVK
jgi:molecular chaperone DnaK